MAKLGGGGLKNIDDPNLIDTDWCLKTFARCSFRVTEDSGRLCIFVVVFVVDSYTPERRTGL